MSHQIIGRSRIEIYVRIHSFLFLHQLFDLLRHLKPFHLAFFLAHRLREFAKPRCARVFGFINGVTDAHNFAFFASSACRATRRLYPHRRFPSSIFITLVFAPPCSGPASAADAARYRAVNVRQRSRNHAGRKGRSV